MKTTASVCFLFASEKPTWDLLKAVNNDLGLKIIVSFKFGLRSFYVENGRTHLKKLKRPAYGDLRCIYLTNFTDQAKPAFSHAPYSLNRNDVIFIFCQNGGKFEMENN